MKNKLIGPVMAATACLSLSACGGVDLWPFRSDKNTERSRAPANATEYRCNGGKSFHVRTLDAGAAMWLILPDRQVRLDKVSDSRYGNGIAVLEINGAEATLTDGPAGSYSGCKAASEK